MDNAIIKGRPIRSKKGLSKKQGHVSVEFRAMMPSKYTACERAKLREFEKTVVGNRIAKVEHIK